MPDIQNKKQYAEYVRTVSQFIERERIHFLHSSPAQLPRSDQDTEDTSEPWYSGTPCECCQCKLGGMREYLYARYIPDNSLVQYTICTDCVYYIEYGRLDDTTMLRVERADA